METIPVVGRIDARPQSLSPDKLCGLASTLRLILYKEGLQPSRRGLIDFGNQFGKPRTSFSPCLTAF